MHDLNHQVLASINAYRVRPWVLAYAKLRADGSHVYVVNAEDSNETLVIRNDFNGGEFDQIDIQSIG